MNCCVPASISNSVIVLSNAIVVLLHKTGTPYVAGIASAVRCLTVCVNNAKFSVYVKQEMGSDLFNNPVARDGSTPSHEMLKRSDPNYANC